MIRCYVATLLVAIACLGVVPLLVRQQSDSASNRSWIAEIADEADRARALDDALLTMARIRENRLQIATNLEDGTTTLHEALEELRLLNEDDAVCWNMLNTLYPDCTEHELLCFQLLVSISTAPSSRDTPAFCSLVPRLEEELQSTQLRLVNHSFQIAPRQRYSARVTP